MERKVLTSEQISNLFKFVQEKKDVIESKNISSDGVLQKEIAWKEIAEKFNRTGVGSKFSWKSLRSKYLNLKIENKFRPSSITKPLQPLLQSTLQPSLPTPLQTSSQIAFHSITSNNESVLLNETSKTATESLHNSRNLENYCVALDNEIKQDIENNCEIAVHNTIPIGVKESFTQTIEIEDLQFFSSLLPLIKTLCTDEKLDLKVQIIHILQQKLKHHQPNPMATRQITCGSCDFFLKSILPKLEAMSEEQQLQSQMRILDVINKIKFCNHFKGL